MKVTVDQSLYDDLRESRVKALDDLDLARAEVERLKLLSDDRNRMIAERNSDIEKLRGENETLNIRVFRLVSDLETAAGMRDRRKLQADKLHADLAALRAAVRRLVRIGSDGGMRAFAVDPDEWGYLAHHEIAAIRAAVEEKV